MVNKVIVFVLTSLVLAPVTARGEGAPTFDCGKAESSAEKLICSDPSLADLDRRLARRFDAAVAVATGIDVGAKDAEKLLRATQRGWISGRDECWKETDLEACVRQAYLRREAELVAQYQLEEPISVQTYFCAGSPADEFVAYRYDTELTAIRFERGDTIAVGALASADAAQDFYLANAGNLSFSGDKALLRDPHGAETSCQLAQ